MKKQILFSLFLATFVMSANAATPWWERPTICQINPTNCYANMGAGYDSEYWDAESNCRGMKYICADALSYSNNGDAALMGRQTIQSGNSIKSDFDTSVLNGDCFGVRKTINAGSMASVNGKYVNVYCSGALNSPDEILPSGGEIMLTTQPTCSQLTQNGFIGVKMGDCYGKRFDDTKYRVDCTGASGITPSRIVILNDAPMTNDGFESLSDANAAFDNMYSVSQTQRQKYFDAE